MLVSAALALVSFISAADAVPPASKAPRPPTLAALTRMNAAFAPVELTADLSQVPPNELAALSKIIQAGKMMDAIFRQQVWSGNETMLGVLAAGQTPLERLELSVFLLNQGPWNRFDANAPFMPGVGPKPASGAFYPADSTKAEVASWLKSLSEADRKAASGFYSVVRRQPNGKLMSVPYSVAYQSELLDAAKLLKEAAALTQQPTLKAFLEQRAQAFVSNDYYASDVAWMKLDASIEPTIGPYEVYEDDWFNAKAAYESFITLRDAAESERLQKFSTELQEVENNLPMDPKFRNPKLGALAPIRVVNSIYASGDGNRGVQTAAYNLPNDERIVHDMGTKRVMLKNVQRAKFDLVLVPIAKQALRPADRANVSFDAFFTHILMHELMHGLGPHNITVNGKATTVRAQMESTYSAFEEAKADIAGLFAMQRFVDRGILDKSLEKTMYVTYLASCFRSIRFGSAEAHGRAVALELNYLLDAGGYGVGTDGRFFVDATKIKGAVAQLTHELMTLQANGDRAGAQAMLDKLGVIRPPVQKVFDRLSAVPVDIQFRFSQADKIVAEHP